MRALFFLFFVCLFTVLASYILPFFQPVSLPIRKQRPAVTTASDLLWQLDSKATLAHRFAISHGLSSHVAFFVDMSLPSSRNRFFVYDFTTRAILISGLVAHGSCNNRFLTQPTFSNQSEGSCTSLGRYKVGGSCNGRFGK